MPLTFPAHQLLVMPLVRGRHSPLPGVALLLGAALPDFAFCVGGYRLNAISHLGYGPLLLAPTLGFLLYAWVEAWFLPALATALPACGRLPVARLCATRGLPARGDRRGWAWALFALVLGAYSHLLFDGFTHSDMWPASVLYRGVLLDMPGLGPMGVARALQIGFSILGSVVVLVWAHRRMHAAPECRETHDWARGLVAAVASIVGGVLVGTAIGLAVMGWPATSREQVFIVMCPATLGAFAGATVFARVRTRQLRGRDAATA